MNSFPCLHQKITAGKNSNMVRPDLELHLFTRSLELKGSLTLFQLKLESEPNKFFIGIQYGTIEGITVHQFPEHIERFQFQYGTIEGNTLCTAFCAAWAHFNSSMVRLKAGNWTNWAWFYPISIPVWYDWRRSWFWSGWWYNCISIPVWYDWRKFNNVARAALFIFQFQYGTIEGTLARILYNKYPEIISIPVWYDWRWVGALLTAICWSISIPVWYDWRGL